MLTLFQTRPKVYQNPDKHQQQKQEKMIYLEKKLIDARPRDTSVNNLALASPLKTRRTAQRDSIKAL